MAQTVGGAGKRPAGKTESETGLTGEVDAVTGLYRIDHTVAAGDGRDAKPVSGRVDSSWTTLEVAGPEICTINTAFDRRVCAVRIEHATTAIAVAPVVIPIVRACPPIRDTAIGCATRGVEARAVGGASQRPAHETKVDAFETTQLISVTDLTSIDHSIATDQLDAACAVRRIDGARTGFVAAGADGIAVDARLHAGIGAIRIHGPTPAVASIFSTQIARLTCPIGWDLQLQTARGVEAQAVCRTP